LAFSAARTCFSFAMHAPSSRSIHPAVISANVLFGSSAGITGHRLGPLMGDSVER